MEAVDELSGLPAIGGPDEVRRRRVGPIGLDDEVGRCVAQELRIPKVTCRERDQTSSKVGWAVASPLSSDISSTSWYASPRLRICSEA
jgi:hypothetical protein